MSSANSVVGGGAAPSAAVGASNLSSTSASAGFAASAASVPSSSSIHQVDSSSSESNRLSYIVCGTRFDIDKKYRLIKPIGHGAYGVVCSAENVETKEKVAIKKITKAFSNLVETKRTLREVKLLRHFRHANIIEILDIMKPESYDKFEDVYIVSELMDTDLHQIITSNQPLTDEHVQYFIYQILRGLKYIHSARVLHRDLKPSNLLLNANCDLKICDFGLARVAVPEEENAGLLTEYVATRWYRAPEIMLSWKEYTKAIDVWSVGCILGEILGRKPLFPGRDYMNQLHYIIDILGSPSYEDTEYIINDKARAYVRQLPFRKRVTFSKLFPHASETCLDLLQRCLQFNPAKRITVDEALQHPYLKLLHDPTDEPVATAHFDFDFESIPTTKETLKALLWNEIVTFHPELAAITPPQVASVQLNMAAGTNLADPAQPVAAAPMPVATSTNVAAVDAVNGINTEMAVEH